MNLRHPTTGIARSFQVTTGTLDFFNDSNTKFTYRKKTRFLVTHIWHKTLSHDEISISDELTLPIIAPSMGRHHKVMIIQLEFQILRSMQLIKPPRHSKENMTFHPETFVTVQYH